MIVQSYAAVNQMGLFNDSKDIPRTLQLNSTLKYVQKSICPLCQRASGDDERWIGAMFGNK